MDKIGIVENSVLIWNQKVPNTLLDHVKRTIEQKYNLEFNSYWDLHKWTIDNYTKFWEEIWNYFGVKHSQLYHEVMVQTGDKITDSQWFLGARFNFAENCLQNRYNFPAIIYLDELMNEEFITYAELYGEVKLYAAAFRKNGLKKEDRVACYMSNRKEAYFVMLAAASIGAIFGGPLPYYGARAASNIIKMMEPKILISVDSHMDDGVEFPLFDNLPAIVDDCPTLERVILVVTKQDTYKKDVSRISNCVFLDDFLLEGRTSDGNVPDMVFEQLPFDHPICINFTSGTTGVPKGVLHSAGAILPRFVDYTCTLNLKAGDVMLTNYTVGWTLWDFFVPSLCLGIQIILLGGSTYATYGGKNFWDICGKYNVNFTFLVTSMVDKMEKIDMTPSPETSLDSLKYIGIGSSPVKKEYFTYIQNKVKRDVFIANLYGTTEIFGMFSGSDLNMPVYGGEIQVPSLGMDVQCFDERGNSVIGERAELVVCTRHPGFPTKMWKDTDDAKLKSCYL